METTLSFEPGQLYENQDYLYYVCHVHKDYVTVRIVGLQKHVVEGEYEQARAFATSNASDNKLKQYAERRLMSLLHRLWTFHVGTSYRDLSTANFLHAVRWPGSINDWCDVRSAWRPEDKEIDKLDEEVAKAHLSMLIGDDKDALVGVTAAPVGLWRNRLKQRFPDPLNQSYVVRDFWLHLYPREAL